MNVRPQERYIQKSTNVLLLLPFCIFVFLYFSGLSLHAAHAGLHIHGLFLALRFMLKITLIMLALADRAAPNPAHLMA